MTINSEKLWRDIEAAWQDAKLQLEEYGMKTFILAFQPMEVILNLD